MSGAVRIERRDSGVAILWLDVPDKPVNVLSEAVLTELADSLDAAIARPGTRAIVLRSAKSTGFCAGADVNRIAECTDREEGIRLATMGQSIYARIERSTIPVVAAVHGPCLGGGLEMALACDGIVVTDEPRTELGLPEVLLGIVPGFGGTQRLPRRIGVIAALDMILTGKRVRAKAAKRSGLADDVVCPFKIDGEAERYALELADGKPARNARARGGWKSLVSRVGILRRFVIAQARKQTLAKTRGLYPAPLRALDLVDRAFALDRSDGYRREAEAIGELLVLDETHRLVDLFLAMEQAKKAGGDARGLVAGDRVAVVGGGVMGSGIARQALSRGAFVRLIDVDPKGLAAGLERIAAAFAEDSRRGRRGAKESERAVDRLSGATRIDGIEGARCVIEAVVERLDVKRQVFARLRAASDPTSPPLFATNTSSLPVAEIGGDGFAPGEVVGLHFFNPVERMPLVEVVAPKGVVPQRLHEAIAIARDLGKTPIVVADAPGFLVNRVLAPYLSEALLLLEEGIAPDTIDDLMLDLGFAMGPLSVLDTVGLEVATAAAKSLEGYLGDRIGRPVVGRLLAEGGKLGRKTNGGIRRAGGGGKRVAAPWLDEMLDRARRERGIVRDPPTIEDARDRMFLIQLNEAAFALVEGVVASARDLDCAMVLGAGFPALRGGPIAEIRRRGAAEVARRLGDLTSRFGVRFQAAPALREGRVPSERAAEGNAPEPPAPSPENP